MGIHATTGIDVGPASAFAGPGRHPGRAASLLLSRATAPLRVCDRAVSPSPYGMAEAGATCFRDCSQTIAARPNPPSSAGGLGGLPPLITPLLPQPLHSGRFQHGLPLDQADPPKLVIHSPAAGRSASDPPRLPVPQTPAGRLQLGLKGLAGGFFARITAPLALVGLAAVRQGGDVHSTGSGTGWRPGRQNRGSQPSPPTPITAEPAQRFGAGTVSKLAPGSMVFRTDMAFGGLGESSQRSTLEYAHLGREGGDADGDRAGHGGARARGGSFNRGRALDGGVVGLIALFSSYDHLSLPHRQLPLQQKWGVWLIALSLPLVFADAQLAARSRCRDADRALKAENETARERNRAAEERQRVARLDALRNRLDRGRLTFQLDPSANNRRKLQRLLSLLNSPELAELYRI